MAGHYRHTKYRRVGDVQKMSKIIMRGSESLKGGQQIQVTPKMFSAGQLRRIEGEEEGLRVSFLG